MVAIAKEEMTTPTRKRKRGAAATETAHSAKREATEDAIETEETAEEVVLEDPAARVVSPAELSQLLSAFELIDCHGALDVKLKAAEFTSLRSALSSHAPLTYLSLQTLVARISAQLNAQRAKLPVLTYDPVEPHYRGYRRRTDEEVAELTSIVADRQVIVDAQANRQAHLEEWLRRAEGLAAGRTRGKRGKGAIPPKGAIKKEVPEASTSQPPPPPRFVLHRALQGAVDVFTTPNLNELSEEALEAMERVTDTDLVAVGHPPPSTIFNQPPTTLASVSPVPHRPPIPKPSAVEARGVDFLNYGAYDSFAPTYDSSNATLTYLESANHRLSRNAWQDQKDGIPLPETAAASSSTSAVEDQDQDLARAALRLPSHRLARTASLLRRIHVAQLNRMRATAELPGPDELDDAAQIKTELGALVEAASGQGTSIIPEPEALRRLHPVATRAGFFGALDVRNPKVVREGVLLAPPGPPKA